MYSVSAGRMRIYTVLNLIWIFTRIRWTGFILKILFHIQGRSLLPPIDGTKNVPFIPAARYLSELKGNFLPKGKSLRNLYLSIESDYTFKQNDPFTGYNTETATGDYWLVNASVGSDIVNKKGKTIFSVHFSGMNLGDVAYQNHLSRLKYTDINNVTGRTGVFNMGRNFGVKVNVPMDFKWN